MSRSLSDSPPSRAAAVRVERLMPMTTGDMRRRLGVAQVEALFDFIPVAAVAAAAGAAILAAGSLPSDSWSPG
jgi:hypothetical protein